MITKYYILFFKKKNNLPPCDHYAINIFSKSNYDFFYKSCVEVNGRDIQHPFRLLPHGHKLKY